MSAGTTSPLIALLPDPGSPALVPLGMAYGALLGYWVARVRRGPREAVATATADGAAMAGTLALAWYLGRTLGLL